MGLRSMGLAVTLAVTAAVLLAGMLWLWPRLARRGLVSIALRAVLLAALQASVLGFVFVQVNRSLEFYSSWSDLLGTNSFTGAVVAAHGGGRNTRRAPAVSVLASGPVGVPGRPRLSGGRLQTVQFRGQASGLTARGYVYLPPGYSAGGPRLPVIVVLSGEAGVPTAVYGARRVAVTVAGQITAGRMRRVIVVMLGRPLTARGCLDIPAGPQVGVFFSEDLPQVMERDYRGGSAASSWAVVGGTGGGYCALQLATSASDPFGFAVAPPGSYTAPPGGDLIPTGFAQYPGAQVAAGPALRNQDDVMWRLRHRPAPPVRVLLAGPGQAGPLLAAVRPPMSITTGNLAPGPWPLAPVFDWIGRALRSPA